jgi:dipeptidyl aminopeptidase/acylaminoacyl peptidase
VDRRNIYWAAPFVLAAAAAWPAEPRSVSVADILGAPFASHLTAASDAEAVAWVVNERGARNIYVGEGDLLEARRLTAYVEDDGQDIPDLRLTPKADGVVFVRGGGPNARGETPNPRSDPAGASQSVWFAPTKAGEPRKLGDGAGPAISPKGDSVALVKSGEVWSARLDATAEAKLLFHARGRASNLRWSPDGSRLVFVSNRGDHSFVGVYDVAAKSLVYLDPSLDEDGSPAWSPDGKSVAFVRRPATPDEILFVPHRSGSPWSVRVADAASGQGRLLWRAEEGRGSVFRPLDAADQILWSSDGRIVFPWERDGWLHLYSIPAAGGRATLLTPGEFEVENVSVGEHGTSLLFSSNQDDIDRRHAWRVSAAGGAPEPLTRGDGLEWSPVATATGQIVVLRADARRPHGAARRPKSSSSLVDLAPQTVPSSFPESALVVPQPVVFSAADGMRIHAQLFLPPGAASHERRPAVVFFHGGSQRQMVLGWHYREYYHNAYAFNQYLAAHGYVVLSVNYRSGIGYGMEFREAESYGANGASEFADVLGAGLYLRERPDVDPKRIGLWGGSYGGYLTALGLARASHLYAVGVDMHGVHDWNVVIRNFSERYDPRRQPEQARRAFESSPMAFISGWRSPVLLIHGDDDRNVPFSESVSLAAALRAQGVSFEQLVFPDEIHELLLHAHWRAAYEAAASFLDRYLLPRGAGPT